MISAIIAYLAGFIIKGISTLGYAGVVIMMGIESACIPLPSEIIMPFAGFLVSRGEMTLLGISLAGALGCLLGSYLAYWVGYYGGRPMIEKYGKYVLLSHHDLEISEKFFDRYGSSAIFISRLLPVVRTFISLPAGIAKMELKRFSVYSFVGSFIWCYALGWIGMKLGDNWDTLGKYFHRFDAVIGLLILIGIIYFIKRHLNHNNKKTL